MQSFESVVCARIVLVVFGVVQELVTQLQGPTQDILTAYNGIQGVYERLLKMRSDEHAHAMLIDNTIKRAAQDAKSNPDCELACMPRHVRGNSTSYRNAVQAADYVKYYEINALNPVLDVYISSISERLLTPFGKPLVVLTMSLVPSVMMSAISSNGALVGGNITLWKNKVYRAYQACFTEILEHHFETKGVACPSAEVFDMQLDDWIQYWSKRADRPDCFVGSKSDPGVLRLLQRDRENCHTFVPIVFLLKVGATEPVQTCTNERGNSYVKLVKTRLRSTMGQDRLNACCMLKIHYSHKIDIKRVLTKFVKKSRLLEFVISLIDDKDKMF
jgi:hypothetical protein